MSDLISRQAAIEDIRNMAIALYGYDSTNIISCAIHRLQNLPSAQPEQRWIPCDDSNPNIDMSFPHSDAYLVTYDSGGMDVAWWSNVNPFWTDHVTEPRWNGVQFAKVIAWMPLPKPYEG